jgi:23S rRNA pseudouridine2605 synthase
MKERLQKILARWGVASRRACEELIRRGHVTVNGVPICQLGFKADPEQDAIQLDGHLLSRVPPDRMVIALNKPAGYLSTCKRAGSRSPTVLDLVPVEARLFPIGRLDRESSGLLLLTNDGEFAHRIMHPRFGCDKEYLVRVQAPLDASQLKRLRSGVVLDDRLAKPLAVHTSSAAAFRITLEEGRKREVRRMIEAVGAIVVELCRIRVGPFYLEDIPSGRWRRLTETEVEELCGYHRDTLGKKSLSG